MDGGAKDGAGGEDFSAPKPRTAKAIADAAALEAYFEKVEGMCGPAPTAAVDRAPTMAGLVIAAFDKAEPYLQTMTSARYGDSRNHPAVQELDRLLMSGAATARVPDRDSLFWTTKWVASDKASVAAVLSAADTHGDVLSADPEANACAAAILALCRPSPRSKGGALVARITLGDEGEIEIGSNTHTPKDTDEHYCDENVILMPSRFPSHMLYVIDGGGAFGVCDGSPDGDGDDPRHDPGRPPLGKTVIASPLDLMQDRCAFVNTESLRIRVREPLAEAGVDTTPLSHLWLVATLLAAAGTTAPGEGSTDSSHTSWTNMESMVDGGNLKDEEDVYGTEHGPFAAPSRFAPSRRPPRGGVAPHACALCVATPLFIACLRGDGKKAISLACAGAELGDVSDAKLRRAIARVPHFWPTCEAASKAAGDPSNMDFAKNYADMADYDGTN